MFASSDDIPLSLSLPRPLPASLVCEALQYIYIWEIYGGLSVSVAISCCCLFSPQAAHTLTFTSFASAYDSPESSVLQGSTGRDGLSGLRLATRSGYTWRQHATAIQRFAVPASELQRSSATEPINRSPLERETVHIHRNHKSVSCLPARL